MKIADAQAWLTSRSSRVSTRSGEVVIGLPLDVAEEIAALLRTDPTPAPEYDLIPRAPEPEPEKVVDTESGPVKVPQKKKKTKKRGR